MPVPTRHYNNAFHKVKSVESSELK